MKKLTKKELRKINIIVTDKGFTVWIEASTKTKKDRYWIIDGSLVKEDGIINVGKPKYKYELDKISAEFENVITFQLKKL